MNRDAVVTDAPWHLELVFNTIAEPPFTGTGLYLGAEYGSAWVAETSRAAPQVAGGGALVRSRHPAWEADQVESALKRPAEVPDGYEKAYYGAGFLNLVDAL